MIITVTMNPAIDKTVEINRLAPGGLNRIKRAIWDAGGKGINVSKTIRELGEKSIATGFLGGNTGKAIASALTEKGIEHDFVWINGETRTNTKVLESDGTVTELNEPGPEVGQEQTEQLMEKLKGYAGYAGKGTLFVLSGSVPKGVDKQIYARIIHMAHEKGAEALLDADGELFSSGFTAGPDIIKPNRAELTEYIGCQRELSKKELLMVARKCREKGVGTVVVSMGKEGALFVKDGYEVFSPSLPVKAHSVVGAGDAMVAALACAWNQKLGNEETVRLCMAAAAGAVITNGTKPPAGAFVHELMEKVSLMRSI